MPSPIGEDWFVLQCACKAFLADKPNAFNDVIASKREINHRRLDSDLRIYALLRLLVFQQPWRYD